MGLFKAAIRLLTSTPKQTGSSYRPIPSNARTVKQWQTWEAARGCVTCGQKGCHRMNHSYSTCTGCGSAYCNGDDCPKTVLRREQAIARRIARHERTWRNWPN